MLFHAPLFGIFAVEEDVDEEEEDIKTGMNLVIPYYSFDFVE